ncbi:undecaprenyl-phosphate glucose phosphotransferase [Salinicola endophyticus]|uniref:Undecaprenyl-phosphate glucose phosphotransferase n=1 Tax=Salinicola endophyticus TaxID=1949083 RepID=A0AB74UG64_9GAMM
MSYHDRRSLQGFDAYTTSLARLLDLAIMLLGGWVAYAIRFGAFAMPEHYFWALPLGALILLLVLPALNVYQTWRGRVRGLLILRLLFGYFLVGAVLALVMFLSQLGAHFSRLWVVLWIAGACFASIGVRVAAYPIVNRLRRNGRNRRNVMLVGDAHSCATAVAHLKRHPESGFDATRLLLVGDDIFDELESLSYEHYRVGDSIAHEEAEVWICLPLSKGDVVKSILSSLSLSTGNVRYMPNLNDFRLINHDVSNLAGLFLLDLTCSPISGGARLLKRAEDIVFSTIILLMLSPVMLGVALGVRLSSPGPVFYRQERVGLNGVSFMMLKFRSMPVDAENQGVKWGGARAKKVTPFGSFIRRFSLDELPQLLNVLKGDMSIVGPRPERTIFVEQFKHEIPGYMQKHMVKAGITGWAQINGWRGDTDLAKRIECDLWYVENWSIWLDVKIIFLTIFKGFFNPNAY